MDQRQHNKVLRVQTTHICFWSRNKKKNQIHTLIWRPTNTRTDFGLSYIM